MNDVADERNYTLDEILADVKAGLKNEDDSLINEILGDGRNADKVDEILKEDDYSVFDEIFENTERKSTPNKIEGETDETEYDGEDPDNYLEYDFSEETLEDGISVLTPDDMNGETDKSEYDGEDPDSYLEYDFSEESLEDDIPVLTPDDLSGETDDTEYDGEDPDNYLEYDFSDEAFEDGIPVLTPEDISGEIDESEYDGDDEERGTEKNAFSGSYLDTYVPGDIFENNAIEIIPDSEDNETAESDDKENNFTFSFSDSIFGNGRDDDADEKNPKEEETYDSSPEAQSDTENAVYSDKEEAKSDFADIYDDNESVFFDADTESDEEDEYDMVYTSDEASSDAEAEEEISDENEELTETEVIEENEELNEVTEKDEELTKVTEEAEEAPDTETQSENTSDNEAEDEAVEEAEISEEDVSQEAAEDENETGDEDEEESDEAVTVYGGKIEKDDFSFEKMYEERKSEKNTSSKTKVFKKKDIESHSLTENDEITPDDEMSESEVALEKEFNEKRKEKIDKFRLFTENLEGDSYVEEEEKGVKISELVKTKKGEDIFSAIEGVDKPKKDNSKRREKRKKRDSKVYDKIDVGRVKLRLTEWARDIKIRTVITFICFILCLVLGAAKTLFVRGHLQILSAVFDNSLIVYAAELVFGLPVLIIALKAFINTVKNSEKFTLSREAAVLCISFFNTVHNVILILTNQEIGKSTMLFGTAVCFAVLFELFGEKKENAMIMNNLKTIARNDNILGIFALENDNKNIASGISKSKEPSVLCTGEVEIPNSFLDSSLTKDKENMFFNISVPVSIVLSIVCGVFSYISYGGVVAFSCAALSALLVSAPVILSPVLVSLIARTNESLNRTGCEVLGYEDVENIDDADAIVIDTADIFSGSISHFHLISRTVRIDTLHAFEIACSVINASGGVLKSEVSEFMKEQKLVLPEVEDIKYEEKLGLSCWVENKCVLLGTETMMKEHNISIPPEYSPEKYEREGSKVFYLAVDTHPTAMFCADYYIGRQAKKQLVDLYKTGVILMLMTTDPHIDEQFVANTLKVSVSSIKTVNSTGAKQIRESIEKTTKQKRTGLIFKKSVVGFLKVINAAFKLYDAQSLAILIQIVSMIFALVVSGVLSFAATGYLPGAIFIIAYHAAWGILGHLVTDKNKK